MSAGPLDRVDLAELAGAFGQLLHAAGVPVSPERSGRFAAAVALVRPAALDDWYWAGRVTLVSGRDEIETYDRVFGQVFRGLADVAAVERTLAAVVKYDEDMSLVRGRLAELVGDG